MPSSHEKFALIFAFARGLSGGIRTVEIRFGFSIFTSMEHDQLDELMVCRLSETRTTGEPCSIILFGASGDLTARKLIPALYHLFKEKQMPPDFRVIGF